jgi:hypothetical protein
MHGACRLTCFTISPNPSSSDERDAVTSFLIFTIINHVAINQLPPTNPRRNYKKAPPFSLHPLHLPRRPFTHGGAGGRARALPPPLMAQYRQSGGFFDSRAGGQNHPLPDYHRAHHPSKPSRIRRPGKNASRRRSPAAAAALLLLAGVFLLSRRISRNTAGPCFFRPATLGWFLATVPRGSPFLPFRL